MGSFIVSILSSSVIFILRSFSKDYSGRVQIRCLASTSDLDHDPCTISSIKLDISLLTSEPSHINIPTLNEPSHPQHLFVRSTLQGKIFEWRRILLRWKYSSCFPGHWPVQFVCPLCPVSSQVLTPIWMEYLMNIKIRFRSPRTNMASIAF